MDENKDKQIENLEEKVSHLSRMLVKSFGYADQDPDTFLQNARKTTEAICRFIYVKEIGEPKSKMMLNDYGRELNQKKIIPDKIGILIGTIQTYGNYAAHAQDDMSATTRDWIAPCQTALANLTNWFFLDYLKGNVPGELLTPVQSYAEANAGKTKARKGIPMPVLLTMLIGILTALGLIGYKYKGSVNSTDPITATDTIVQKQQEIVSKLNENTPNPDAKRIAVIYFDNSSEEKDMIKLRKGLADMLISDLSKVKMLSVIERDKLEELLKEQKLNNSKEFDASTASKLGRLLGVQYILTGAYFEMMGTFRVDARIIEVETGKIIKSEGVDGATPTFFDLEKKLVLKIVSGLNVDLSVEENKSISETKNVSYEISLLFSDALDLMDKGESTKAIDLLKKVLEKNPDFEPAKKALQKLNVQA